MARTTNLPITPALKARHRRLVAELVAGARPVKPAPSLWQQWTVWLAFALAAVWGVISMIGPQFELMDRLGEPAMGGFLALSFLLSAFCAWMGIASSKPDRVPRNLSRFLALAGVLFLYVMPFLFFAGDDLARVFTQNSMDGWFCARIVLLVAFPSWLLLGWMASRNASFDPGWTGAWLGASAFLLGTGTIQLHCARWEACHMLVDHLLPMAVLIFIPIWAGSVWFSRWMK